MISNTVAYHFSQVVPLMDFLLNIFCQRIEKRIVSRPIRLDQFKESMLPFVKSKYIKTKEEALMFAAAFIYSGENEFDYVVELDEGYEKTSVADITNMIVRRKG